MPGGSESDDLDSNEHMESAWTGRSGRGCMYNETLVYTFKTGVSQGDGTVEGCIHIGV